jgi:hypothetical protein
MVNFLPDKENPNTGSPAEVPPSSENAENQPPEIKQPESKEIDPITVLEKTPPKPKLKTPPQAPKPPKDPILKSVEDILSEDLGDAFSKMTPDQKKKFKEKGEEISVGITKMLKNGKLKIKKIITWLTAWLSMIIGVNKYFIEQKVKLKIDKLLNLEIEQKK